MVDEVIKNLREEMEQTVTALRRELSRTRTGRASTALLEGLTVEYYGATTPLIQLATINVPEPRLLVIQPFDRSAMAGIEKAILQSDLGLVPANDGRIIRVPIPELTEERRRELVKHIRKVAEDFRVSMRNHRRDAIEMLKVMQKDKEITEDDQHRTTDKITEMTKEFIEKLDHVLEDKEKEIMEV